MRDQPLGQVCRAQREPPANRQQKRWIDEMRLNTVEDEWIHIGYLRHDRNGGSQNDDRRPKLLSP